MLFESHEILGTDKPIFKAKKEEHWTYEALVNLDMDLNDFQMVGYVPVVKGQMIYYKGIYDLI
jgi:hypothetical protein